MALAGVLGTIAMGLPLLAAWRAEGAPLRGTVAAPNRSRGEGVVLSGD
jgi:hypothetical protein